jgi:hypothetical protein
VEQDPVFNDIGQATLDNAFSGYNVCVFAYGQTGSGKSYSMVGSEEDRGIVPRVAMALFEYIERQKVCFLCYFWCPAKSVRFAPKIFIFAAVKSRARDVCTMQWLTFVPRAGEARQCDFRGCHEHD